jgi:hypothetical protein
MQATAWNVCLQGKTTTQFRSYGRHSPDALIWTGWSQEGLHLKNVLREVFGCFRRVRHKTRRSKDRLGRSACGSRIRGADKSQTDCGANNSLGSLSTRQQDLLSSANALKIASTQQ